MHSIGLPFAVCATGAVVLFWRRQRSRSSKQKPQAKFIKVLTDNSDAPFQHLGPEGGAAQPGIHPMHEQIHALDQKPPEILSRPMDMPEPLQQKTCRWVASLRDLQAMVADLRGADMLAVDVEHHHMHSYLGFVCLLQLSAGGIDYVVDALALHDHLHCLRPLLADPSTLKVVHGGDNDVIWLQRDFHLYMVNVFDTEKACQVLGRHQRGLAKLLDAYCGIATDKSFQKSDWRVRPLSKAQLEYAQRDAHYLLYIAHKLYQELQAADAANPDSTSRCKAMMQAWGRCQKVSLNVYSKQTSQAAASTAAATILRKRGFPPKALSQLSLDYPGRPAQQVAADNVHALCRWRDQVARQEDEGLHAILPEAVLLALATGCPSTASAVMACAQQALDDVQAAKAQRQGSAYSHRAALIYLHQEADHVAKLLTDSATGTSAAATVDAFSAAAHVPQNRNQARQLMTPEERQAAMKERLVKKFSAKSAVYENCKMLSQEGRLLCFCDLRKLTWYENRGLADRVSDDPPTIKLRFMHKTGDQERGVDDYYLHSKENKCVSCGEEGHYLRYRVVPACYRRNFPVQWKSHRSHDIILLCVDCHHIAHRAAERVKRELSQEYNVPLTPPKVKPEGLTPGAQVHPYNVRRAAIALRQNAHSLPEKRRHELQQIVRGYVNQEQRGARTDGEGWLTQNELDQALLAGLAPRQRRRTLRQLAAEKAAQGSDSRASEEGDGRADTDEQSAADSSDNAGPDHNEMRHQNRQTLRQLAAEHAASKAASNGKVSGLATAGVQEGRVHLGNAADISQEAAGRDSDEALVEGSVPSKKDPLTTSGMANADPNADHDPASCDAYQRENHATASQQGQPDAFPHSADQASSSQDAVSGLDPRHNTSLHGDVGGQQDEPSISQEHGAAMPVVDSNGHHWHGRKVVAAAMAQGGTDALLRLIQRFRQSFTESLNPQFLPASWHVAHSAERDFGKHSIYASQVQADHIMTE